MEIDNECGVEDFAAKIAAVSDHSLDSEDECEFCGFFGSVHAARNIEEEGKEEDGPLYRIEVLTSGADALVSSPSKASDNLLLREEPSEDEDENDHDDTLLTRKVTVKGKGKVMGKGRQVMTGEDLRKTKGTFFEKW